MHVFTTAQFCIDFFFCVQRLELYGNDVYID